MIHAQRGSVLNNSNVLTGYSFHFAANTNKEEKFANDYVSLGHEYDSPSYNRHRLCYLIQRTMHILLLDSLLVM